MKCLFSTTAMLLQTDLILYCDEKLLGAFKSFIVLAKGCNITNLSTRFDVVPLNIRFFTFQIFLRAEDATEFSVVQCRGHNSGPQ